MATSAPNQYPVHLTAEQRVAFEAIAATGKAPAAKIRHARVLLLTDRDRPNGPYTDPQIADALSMHVNTVARIRKRFVREGEAPALNRKVRVEPPTPAKIDGRAEAHLVATCCSAAPEGHSRWTLQLLADELKKRGLVSSVSTETVRLALKKTNCSRGVSSAGVSRNASRRGSQPRWRTSSTCIPPSTRRRNPSCAWTRRVNNCCGR